jgi:hypothetical protein
VHFKGGVMDVVAGSGLSAVADMGSTRMASPSPPPGCTAEGVASLEELEFIAWRLLFNDCIEQVT